MARTSKAAAVQVGALQRGQVSRRSGTCPLFFSFAGSICSSGLGPLSWRLRTEIPSSSHAVAAAGRPAMPDSPEPRAGAPPPDDARSTRELYDRFAERLLALARRRLSPRLASRADPEDIGQSVFRTFFGWLKDGRLHVEDPEDV